MASARGCRYCGKMRPAKWWSRSSFRTYAMFFVPIYLIAIVLLVAVLAGRALHEHP
jgi:hypothetical protein